MSSRPKGRTAWCWQAHRGRTILLAPQTHALVRALLWIGDIDAAVILPSASPPGGDLASWPMLYSCFSDPVPSQMLTSSSSPASISSPSGEPTGYTRRAARCDRRRCTPSSSLSLCCRRGARARLLKADDHAKTWPTDDGDHKRGSIDTPRPQREHHRQHNVVDISKHEVKSLPCTDRRQSLWETPLGKPRRWVC